jgi:hypothetical protein
MAPSVMRVLRVYVPGTSEHDTQHQHAVAGDADAGDLPILMEAVRCVEALVAKTSEEKKLPLVSLLVQLLLSQLLDDPFVGVATASERARHEYALGRLNAIGPLHAQHFKLVCLANSLPVLVLYLTATAIYRCYRRLRH